MLSTIRTTILAVDFIRSRKFAFQVFSSRLEFVRPQGSRSDPTPHVNNQHRSTLHAETGVGYRMDRFRQHALRCPCNWAKSAAYADAGAATWIG